MRKEFFVAPGIYLWGVMFVRSVRGGYLERRFADHRMSLIVMEVPGNSSPYSGSADHVSISLCHY